MYIYSKRIFDMIKTQLESTHFQVTYVSTNVMSKRYNMSLIYHIFLHEQTSVSD